MLDNEIIPVVRGRLTEYRADLDISNMLFQTTLLFAIDDEGKVLVLPFADFAVDDVSVQIDIVPDASRNLRNTYQRIRGTLRLPNECAQCELTDSPEGFVRECKCKYLFPTNTEQRQRSYHRGVHFDHVNNFRCISRVCNGRTCFGQCRLDKELGQCVALVDFPLSSVTLSTINNERTRYRH